ncbi:MAG: hypothetical protein KGL39_39020 [Patescibacteria group bacterium]|nr:hypothetical protein [Patescibacteria group bacterium]
MAMRYSVTNKEALACLTREIATRYPAVENPVCTIEARRGQKVFIKVTGTQDEMPWEEHWSVSYAVCGVNIQRVN